MILILILKSTPTGQETQAKVKTIPHRACIVEIRIVKSVNC